MTGARASGANRAGGGRSDFSWGRLTAAVLSMAAFSLLVETWILYAVTDVGDETIGNFKFGLTFVCAFLALPAFMVAVSVGAVRLQVAAGVLAALLVLWPGYLLGMWLRGPVYDLAWTAYPDRPDTVLTEGVWAPAGDAADTPVVRARTDGLVAHGPRSRADVWRLAAPPRKSLCAMSDRTSGGVGLVAFARHQEPCDTVWAVDVRSGRKLWEHTYAGVPGSGPAGDGLVAVDESAAVVLADGRVQAFGPKDGKKLWTHETAEGCVPSLVSSAAGRTRVVVRCEATASSDAARTTPSYEVLTLDGASGTVLREASLPVESDVSAWVLSADPFVLWVREDDPRGLDAILVHGEGDGEPVSIPVSGGGEDLLPLPQGEEGGWFTARPELLSVVSGDRLLVATAAAGSEDRPTGVAAYSLENGRRLWHTEVPEFEAMALADDDRLAVYADYDEKIAVLDVSTGHRDEDEDSTVHPDVSTGTGVGVQMVRTSDGWLFVNHESDENPSVIAVRRP